MASPLANAIQFFKDFGLFDVVLPFLLVFTIVFAILEKTKILGVEDGKPKKNLDSMVAFVIGLLVVATNKIVNALNAALPNVVLLIVVSVSFLLLIGMFWKSDEMDFMTKHKTLYQGFVIFFLIAVILIFSGSIEKEGGVSWLSYFYDYVMKNWGGSVVSSFIMLLVIIFAVYFVASGGKKTESGG